MNVFRKLTWRIKVRARSGHLLVCDDRGTTRWPSTSKTWCLGGFIIPYWTAGAVTRTWRRIKRELTSDPDAELKWSHFFQGPHQENSANPLATGDPNEWRNQAIWALDRVTSHDGLVPVNTIVRKDRAADGLFRPSTEKQIHGGYRVLETETLWVGVLGSLSIYLDQVNSVAEIWLDKMGSDKEQRRWQELWLETRDGEWKVKPENQLKLKAISPELRIVESSRVELMQVADFISGVIWAASEEDQEFLERILDRYFPLGIPSYTLVTFE